MQPGKTGDETVRLTPARLTMLLLLMVAVLVGVFVWRRFFTEAAAPPPVAERPRLRTVPMALTDLLPGTVITSQHVGMGPFDTSKLERDMFLTNRGIIGRVVKEKIAAAEPMRSTQLYAPNELPDLKLADGMVAYSIPIENRVQMVDGMIKPGNFIDVLWFRDTRSFRNNVVERDGSTAQMLMKGVKILAINRNTAAVNSTARNNTVTLQVTSGQAMQLKLALESGSLQFLYTPIGNGGGVDPLQAKMDDDQLSMRELLGLKTGEPPKPYHIEHFRSHGRGVIDSFDENGLRRDLSPLFNRPNDDRWYQYQDAQPQDDDTNTTTRSAPRLPNGGTDNRTPAPVALPHTAGNSRQRNSRQVARGSRVREYTN